MDKRSWPWKKKSSTTDDKGKTKNVQISAESYAHLVEMEAQVKILNEKVSSAQSDMTAKDNLVKQHAKVAEDAIAGWEKAEAETSALKTQLESVTLLKLTAEDKVSHLDDALKECMKEIRNVKEESEQILHDTIFVKTKQWEAIKSDFEAKISDFEQELLKNSAEYDALARALQERSSMLIRISNEKSQAEADIEFLKSGIQSCEKEINSLKYEVHVVTKELEIRNEEKNMSVRLSESANKQHIEDMKKINKLEAECQRLRSLVKKKLPGPAALAQMKLEVENLGETRLRRSPIKGSNSYLTLPPNFSLEEMQHCQKENEYLTAQLLATEQETKILKEALSRCNSELHTTRSVCAKSSSKLRSMEAQVLVMNQEKGHKKSNTQISFEGFYSQNPSFASMSEDGIDEEGSCAESWSTSLVSENNIEKSKRAEKSKNMESMDDFLKMEKLACLSTETGKITENRTCEKDIKLCINKLAIDEEIKNAITQIHDIIVPLCKEAVERYSGDSVLQEKVKEFSDAFNKVICDEVSLDDFIFALSHMLSETRHVRFNMSSKNPNPSEDEGSSNDYIDKLTLLETQHESKKQKLSGELAEYEQMKLEKESVKVQLVETEQQLEEVKSRLTACQKSNSLADTQLKCMAESYKSLESRMRELEIEMNVLRSKAEALDGELEEERHSHQDDLAKYKELQEQIERDTRCSLMCSLHTNSDVDKAKQEREIAAAAEKLAECQETILLLGKQLKSMQPPIIHTTQNGYSLQSILNTTQSDQASIDNDDASSVIYRTVLEEDDYNFEPVQIPRPESSKRQKSRSRSVSASSLSSMLSDKQSRGFSRFFSRGKRDH